VIMKKKSFLAAWVFVLMLSACVATTTGPAAPDLPDDLDAYLKQSEARFTDLRPNNEKLIVWSDPSKKAKTPFSIIYFHGFSACRLEVAPLCDIVARDLGANLFYTRLSGHGRPGQALAEVTMADWQRDANEALAIGRRLGDRVIVIATSTGGALATWLVSNAGSKDIQALVLISPNFGLRNKSASVMTWPLARYYVPLLAGKTRSLEPCNPKWSVCWPCSYPMISMIPVMKLVKEAWKSPVEKITAPVMAFYSPDDKIVEPARTEIMIRRFGSTQRKIVKVQHSSDPDNHVITGRIMSPENTGPFAGMIVDFIRAGSGS
jgi:esterase/lipase